MWPAEADGQNATQHLDIQVSDLEAAITHALDAGATLADFQPQEAWRVLLDPAGHPFCLFTGDLHFFLRECGSRYINAPSLNQGF